MRLTYIKILLTFPTFFFFHFSPAQKKAKEDIRHLKEDTKQKAAEKSKTILGGFLNTDIRNPARHMGLEATAYTNGYGIGLFYLKRQSGKISRYYAIDLAEIKHDKEERLKPQLYETDGKGKPLPYIYGKQNSFYRLNLSYGIKRVLIPSLVSPGIDLSLLVNGGISVGMIKPYYLKLNVSDTLNRYIIEDRKYSVSDESNFLNAKKIYGRSSFGTGLTESTITPGLHLSASLLIDLSSRAVWLKTISFGSAVSVYSSTVPLMVDAKAKPLFVNLFMRVSAGKGW